MCVPELRGDAEELRNTPYINPAAAPRRLPAPPPALPHLTPRTMLQPPSMQEPIPAAPGGLEPALCVSSSCLIRMVNNDFSPISLYCF